jgi:hypothetical protein
MSLSDGKADRSEANLPKVASVVPRAKGNAASPSTSAKAVKPTVPAIEISDSEPSHRASYIRVMIASFASLFTHSLALVCFGLWYLEVPSHSEPTVLIVKVEPRETTRPEKIETLPADSSAGNLMPAQLDPFPPPVAFETEVELPQFASVGMKPPTTEIKIGGAADLEAKGKPRGPTGISGTGGTGTGGSGGTGGDGAVGELAGLRSAAGRKAAGMARGATPESETAVEMALKWFLNHQQADGSWLLDHRTRYCTPDCNAHGMVINARVAATSLALLPFLGAGYTHREGKYHKEIARGLKFLERHFEKNGNAAGTNGGMYAHGLATITLCEAYNMTGDRALLRQAQRAINFIPYAQDPVGGGWRYVPGQPGDTSIVGWQLMALKSGQISGITVPKRTIDNAARFLDSVQLKGGFEYGYLPTHTESRTSTTAIAILCRMLMGWERDYKKLVDGVQHLSVIGPSETDYYYNYYATQVMHNFEGPMWDRWNLQMRDQLVKTQSKRGHSAGSWYIDGGEDDHNDMGGRHYCTALATMTLEVYYRYLPLYGAGKAKEEK